MSICTEQASAAQLGRFVAELPRRRSAGGRGRRSCAATCSTTLRARWARTPRAPRSGRWRDRGPAEATLLCDGDRVGAEHAAFANAALMHARAQDDTHFAAKTHVGSAVMPAALAMAERDGARRRGVRAARDRRLRGRRPPSASRLPPRRRRAASAPRCSSARSARPRPARRCSDSTRRESANAIAIASSFSGGLNQTWIDGTQRVALGARHGRPQRHRRRAPRRRRLLGARALVRGRRRLRPRVRGPGARRDGDWELGERWRILDVIYKPYPGLHDHPEPGRGGDRPGHRPRRRGRRDRAPSAAS